MDQRGIPSTFASVRAMASLSASQHEQPVQLGKHWIQNFIKQYNTLKSKYNSKYDYKRAQCENSALLGAWFKAVQRSKIQYSILDRATYNFDKTGFQMCVILTAKVITTAEHAGRPRTTQPGN
jgi:hypothetical protein